ncbi:septin-9 isoform X5 [Pleurodeles waltl]|uniref:septin-9 isoform X5 n=1 Tax=Pleurodeles waltl TaxID=8319 RepID=UPI00370963B9
MLRGELFVPSEAVSGRCGSSCAERAPERTAVAGQGTDSSHNYTGRMADTARDLALRQQALPVHIEKPVPDFGYVGIDAILEQMRRKAMKQGFELNIMMVGQSGLGKSTLINTLFKSKVSRKSVQPTAEERIPKTIEIKTVTHDIEEKGVRMKLTVIDTPGFGDHINNENCWQPIMKFINDQYEKYLQEEININRKKRIPDSRVHCCIYFIPATGHSLRPLDIEFMRRLSKVVNIVPVIAKADTLTLDERDYFKQRIRADLQSNGIDVYPQKEFDEDAEDRLLNEKIREMIPFAVVGSDQEYQVNGRRILGRKTKWGTIEVENTGHCEFAYLRDLLIRTHMQNIKDITSSIHFEAYRVRRLNEGNVLSNGMSDKDHMSNEM